MKEIIDFILHIQEHLTQFTSDYGGLVYALLFLIVFCETGLVVTPFLPGDSLLFAVGALAADPSAGLNVWIAAIVLLVAAILGDTANYWIGRKCGQWMMRKFPRIVKPEHIAKTNEFFVRYGGKTIILARFVPIVRTFAPFVAGSGEMDYKRFMSFNVIGAVLWVGLLLPAGWFLGNAEFTIGGRHIVVKDHFEIVVLAIIGISVLPIIIEFVKAKMKPKAVPNAAE
ncbi:DedA family protein [Luteolibacter arcticus]|uniref:DedA family protein n=1 Tax=Luteolibacter arcticus TaxID=1581411 RepID=A0ABT3GC26_9BACT|nr:DedA family protein [Luteolibacter arcticus]MCW1920968.1 DedA family protein [Luteolibacter arcticus]